MTKDELDKYKALEFVVKKLVDYCNNVEGMATACEVIAVEAALERLYKARQRESERDDMNRSDIMRMAREAGMPSIEITTSRPVVYPVPEALERFAALVAAAEREECAALCSEVAAGKDAEAIEEAIRARGEK